MNMVGFFSAILGVIASFALYYYAQYKSTKRQLKDYLLFLSHDVWNKCDEGEHRVLFNSTLKELWALYNAAYEYTPYWKRKELEKAWWAYRGFSSDIIKDLQDNNREDKPSLIASAQLSQHFSGSRQDMIDKIEKIIKVI